MIRVVLAGALALTLGGVTLAAADPTQSPSCGDHIHVKGHVRDAQGGGIAGARAMYGEAATGSGAGAGKDLPFLQGLPSGCLCRASSPVTGSDGSYDFKIELSTDPRCTSAIDRITVDKTKLYWRKEGVTIVPAP